MSVDQYNAIRQMVRCEMVFCYMERRPMTVLRFS